MQGAGLSPHKQRTPLVLFPPSSNTAPCVLTMGLPTPLSVPVGPQQKGPVRTSEYRGDRFLQRPVTDVV